VVGRSNKRDTEQVGGTVCSGATGPNFAGFCTLVWTSVSEVVHPAPYIFYCTGIINYYIILQYFRATVARRYRDASATIAPLSR